jgi:HlyD family secretion protein
MQLTRTGGSEESDRTPKELGAVGTPQRPEPSAPPSQRPDANKQTGSNKPSDAPPPKRKKNNTAIFILLFLLAAGALAFFGWRNYAAKQEQKGKLFVSGRIEGYETNLGAKIGGRVQWIKYREGNIVQPGELVARLSDDDYQAQLRGAQARVKKAIESKDQAIQQVQVAQTAVDQSELNKLQAMEDTKGKVFQAQSQVASAKALLSQADAEVTQSEADLKLANLRKERYDTLALQGAVMQDQADQADTTVATTKATLEAKQAALESAKKQLAAAQGNLMQQESTRLNPPIRSSQLTASQRQLIQAQSQLKSASDEIHNAQSDVDQIKANIAYLNIPSTIYGYVTARPVEPGAVVTAGQTVLSCINLDTVYLRGYVPEGSIGKVRVDQDALVYLDSAPKTGLPGTVIEIDPEASFTPENIYFRDDRVKQVFGIKIAIKDPKRFPKPGMPADAEIVLKETK